jgi:starvation-inducible outer membrane lipoprotein
VTRLLALLLLAGCGPIPVQISSQKQTQSSKQEVSQEVAQDQAQSSAHQSAAKQGTNSMPVIIICNTNNSPGARCATQPEDAPILREVQSKIHQGAGK